jgi:hypothetical protein
MEDHFAAEHVQFGSRPYIILEMVKFFRNLAKMLQGYVVLVAEYADRTERDNILERVEPACMRDGDLPPRILLSPSGCWTVRAAWGTIKCEMPYLGAF